MGDFGRFPDSFRNCISKRNRSSYVTTSKTHSLTNAQFEEIVKQPCYYCGKEHRPPLHYNGLDRLDSTKRVYTTKSCVSCCGTCNMSKSRLTEQQFLEHCLRVAKFNVAPGAEAAAATAAASRAAFRFFFSCWSFVLVFFGFVAERAARADICVHPPGAGVCVHGVVPVVGDRAVRAVCVACGQTQDGRGGVRIHGTGVHCVRRVLGGPPGEAQRNIPHHRRSRELSGLLRWQLEHPCPKGVSACGEAQAEGGQGHCHR
mmetsp:Transcript_21674/g.42090  ORF Transcript_21674/g.42090 Transcript_21674/m.42090 type:complete len:259 (+) Transcript_21674:3-779(+)